MIAAINQRYFEGQQVLFPNVTQGLEELVEHTERLVELYNRNLAEELDRLAILLLGGESGEPDAPFSLDLKASEKLAGKSVGHQVAYLTDMAKVEALDTMGENRKAVELLDRHV